MAGGEGSSRAYSDFAEATLPPVAHVRFRVNRLAWQKLVACSYVLANHPSVLERQRFAFAWRALARYVQALFLRAFSSAEPRNCIAPAQRAYTRGSPREWSEQICAKRLASAMTGAEDVSILLSACFAASSTVWLSACCHGAAAYTAPK